MEEWTCSGMLSLGSYGRLLGSWPAIEVNLVWIYLFENLCSGKLAPPPFPTNPAPSKFQYTYPQLLPPSHLPYRPPHTLSYKIFTVVLGLRRCVHGPKACADRLVHEVGGLFGFPGGAVDECWERGGVGGGMNGERGEGKILEE